jgi:hypothetical protein
VLQIRPRSEGPRSRWEGHGSHVTASPLVDHRCGHRASIHALSLHPTPSAQRRTTPLTILLAASVLLQHAHTPRRGTTCPLISLPTRPLVMTSDCTRPYRSHHPRPVRSLRIPSIRTCVLIYFSAGIHSWPHCAIAFSSLMYRRRFLPHPPTRSRRRPTRARVTVHTHRHPRRSGT